ncbi:GNAT family N-acetyltransferase [Amycolatopsis anabasis]|uniref:GNAT family N-acetyltransferase n=1 Tax=Amycolatopsis anabasis TaxID=1840409 RepID=UPI00131B9A15|nr:GNAT family N-acetyltransferase [Amycolatopsis anabasis]
MTPIGIRLAEESHLAAVAELRWRWELEYGGPQAVPRDDFVRHFVAWARENASSHRCLVVVRGEVVLGMAWLAIIRRVPTPRALERASGDVQSVYVVPEERDSGLGGRLIKAILELGRQLGLERVTVHSSDRAIPAYARHGFAHSPRLLQAKVVQTDRRPRATG